MKALIVFTFAVLILTKELNGQHADENKVPPGKPSIALSQCLLDQCGPTAGLFTAVCNFACSRGGKCISKKGNAQCSCEKKRSFLFPTTVLICSRLCRAACQTCGRSNGNCTDKANTITCECAKK